MRAVEAYGAVVAVRVDLFTVDGSGHAWDDSEREALVGYSAVVEATLRAAMGGRNAGELAGQLQYALDNRLLIERAVGFVMGRTGTDAVGGCKILRTAARRNRRKVAEVADEVLRTGTVPASGR